MQPSNISLNLHVRPVHFCLHDRCKMESNHGLQFAFILLRSWTYFHIYWPFGFSLVCFSWTVISEDSYFSLKDQLIVFFGFFFFHLVYFCFLLYPRRIFFFLWLCFFILFSFLKLNFNLLSFHIQIYLFMDILGWCKSICGSCHYKPRLLLYQLIHLLCGGFYCISQVTLITEGCCNTRWQDLDKAKWSNPGYIFSPGQSTLVQDLPS